MYALYDMQKYFAKSLMRFKIIANKDKSQQWVKSFHIQNRITFFDKLLTVGNMNIHRLIVSMLVEALGHTFFY